MTDKVNKQNAPDLLAQRVELNNGNLESKSMTTKENTPEVDAPDVESKQGSCCWIDCPKDATWRAWEGPSQEDYTEACDDHLGVLLSDAPEHRVFPISADVESGRTMSAERKMCGTCGKSLIELERGSYGHAEYANHNAVPIPPTEQPQAELISLKAQLSTAQKAFTDLREADAESLLEALAALGEVNSRAEVAKAQLLEMTKKRDAKREQIWRWIDRYEAAEAQLATAQQSFTDLREDDAKSLLEALTALGKMTRQRDEWAGIAGTNAGAMVVAESQLATVREETIRAKEIIEQYPHMVRNILSGKSVRNVDELEAQANSWLSTFEEKEVSR
jgi:hypothetical protein